MLDVRWYPILHWPPVKQDDAVFWVRDNMGSIEVAFPSSTRCEHWQHWTFRPVEHIIPDPYRRCSCGVLEAITPAPDGTFRSRCQHCGGLFYLASDFYTMLPGEPPSMTGQPVEHREAQDYWENFGDGLGIGD